MFGNQSEVLKNILRPETVIALENVPFILRAQALEGVEQVSFHLHEVPLTEGNPDGETFNVRRAIGHNPDIEERMVVLERYVIAGGLIYDRDSGCLNPCGEGTAKGSIFHVDTRRGGAAERRSYFDALGLDNHGERDFNCQPVCERLVACVMKGIGNDLSTFKRLQRRLRATGRSSSKASLESVIRYAIDQGGWEYALDYLAQTLWGVDYWDRVDSKVQGSLQPLVELFSRLQIKQCWNEVRAAGEVGNPLAVLLDIYEHSGVVYSVTGDGMQCRWDTSRGAAVWVPDEQAINNIRPKVLSEYGVAHEEFDALMYAKAVEYCKAILDEYNNWANGNVYGVLVYVINRSTGRVIQGEEDECGGFIGSQHAEEKLEALVLSKALQYGQTVI